MSPADARDRYLEQLHERIERLEIRHRLLFDALRQIDSLGYLRERLGAGADEATLLDNLIADLGGIFRLEAIAVSLVDEATQEFTIRRVRPPEQAEPLRRELDRQIEAGVFAWSLRHRRSTVVGPLADLADRGPSLVLAPLSTGPRTLGMALLVVDESAEEIDAGRLTFLSILGKLYSFALENSALQRRLAEQNLHLEEEVRRRARQIEEAHAQLAAQHAELQAAYEHRLEVDRMKDEFLSLVSHELRTPLAGILGHARALLDGVVDGPDEEAQFLRTIHKEGERLHRLVLDLLDLSKMEAGRIAYHFEPIPIGDPIHWALSTVRSAAADKGVTVRLASATDHVVRGDLDRLTQVVTNVLDNAIKFTPAGGRVEVTVRGAGDRVEVSIGDDGPGIAPADLPRIFDKFEQVESTAHHTSGSGLGLAISSAIVQAHGGQMSVESAVGAGTTFRFTVPLAQGAAGSDVVLGGSP